MILSLIYIFALLLIGVLIVIQFKLSDIIKIVSFSIPIGILITGWIVFLISLAFGKLCIKSILFSDVIFLAIIFLYILKKRKYIRKKIRMMKYPKFNEFIFPFFLFILLSSYFLFGFHFDNKGNLLCYNGFCSDGPWHIILINSFVNSKVIHNFPLFYGANMVYPSMIDFITSILVTDGINIFTSIKIIDILLIFSIVFSLFYFLRKLTKNLFISNMTMLFFFFFSPSLENYIFRFLFPHIIPSERILYFHFFNFANVIMDIFHPQRSYLIGFPIVMIFLYFLLEAINKKEYDIKHIIIMGIVVGILPFFHTHSFIAINIFAIILLFEWFDAYIVYLLTVLTVSFPQIFFIITQHKANNFFGVIINAYFWNITKYGFFIDRLSFWLLGFGFILITGIIGFLLNKSKKINLFALPPIVTFILINIVRMQPSFGDSNKLTIYLLLFLALYSAILVNKLIHSSRYFLRIISIMIIIVLMMGFTLVLYHDWYSNRLKIYETDSYNENYPILFHKCDFVIAKKIYNATSPDDILLSYYTNTFVSPIYLSRRQVFMDNIIYLKDIGILRNDGKSPDDVSKIVNNIYTTGNMSDIVRENITCIFVSPRERYAYGNGIYNFSGDTHFKDVLNLECGGSKFNLFCIKD